MSEMQKQESGQNPSSGVKDRRKALIIDFGGVYALGKRPTNLFRTQLAHNGRMQEREVDKIWRKNVAQVWCQLARGEMTDESFWTHVSNTYAMPIDWRTIEKAALDSLTVNEGLRSIVMKVRQAGIITAMLTDNVADWIEYIKKNRPELIEPFHSDGTLFSSHSMGMLKPDGRIYRQACIKLDIEPQQCLFVDDIDRNVNGARSIGMHAMCYNLRAISLSNKMLEARLKQLGM